MMSNEGRRAAPRLSPCSSVAVTVRPAPKAAAPITAISARMPQPRVCSGESSFTLAEPPLHPSRHACTSTGFPKPSSGLVPHGAAPSHERFVQFARSGKIRMPPALVALLSAKFPRWHPRDPRSAERCWPSSGAFEGSKSPQSRSFATGQITASRSSPTSRSSLYARRLCPRAA